jgi:hypothetical protein
MHESFLVYRGFRYLKLSLALMLLSILSYLLHDPSEPPNGGTWLGYTLGTIGGLLILWLLWFGVRKRQYHSRLGQVTGWLSGHVYLGSALLVVATLHCGFQFDWNVHTLTYVLMVMVIASGFYGVFTYLRYPTQLTQNRGGIQVEAMLSEIADLDRQCLVIADQIGDKVHQIILRSIERTSFGGSLWKNPLPSIEKGVKELAEELKSIPRITQQQTRPAPLPQQGGDESTLFFMADQLASIQSSARAEQVRRLLDLITSKKALVMRVQQDRKYHALMKAWLYIHVPLSIALLAALIAHVISVFFYW